MELDEFVKMGENLPSVIEREKFLANQALVFLTAEIFVLMNSDIFMEENWINIIAIIGLKISAILFGGSLLGASFLIMRLGYAKDQIFAIKFNESNQAYDKINRHLDFASKAIPIIGNLWILGLVFGLVVAVYAIFII